MSKSEMSLRFRTYITNCNDNGRTNFNRYDDDDDDDYDNNNDNNDRNRYNNEKDDKRRTLQHV